MLAEGCYQDSKGDLTKPSSTKCLMLLKHDWLSSLGGTFFGGSRLAHNTLKAMSILSWNH